MKVYSIRLIHPHADNFPRASYYESLDKVDEQHGGVKQRTQIAIDEWLIVTPFTERGPSLIYLVQEVEVWG